MFTSSASQSRRSLVGRQMLRLVGRPGRTKVICDDAVWLVHVGLQERSVTSMLWHICLKVELCQLV